MSLDWFSPLCLWWFDSSPITLKKLPLLSPTIKYHTGQSFKWCIGDASQTMWLGLDNQVHAVDGFVFFFLFFLAASWLYGYRYGSVMCWTTTLEILSPHISANTIMKLTFLFLWITNVWQKKGILVQKCAHHEFLKGAICKMWGLKHSRTNQNYQQNAHDALMYYVAEMSTEVDTLTS